MWRVFLLEKGVLKFPWEVTGVMIMGGIIVSHMHFSIALTMCGYGPGVRVSTVYQLSFRSVS